MEKCATYSDYSILAPAVPFVFCILSKQSVAVSPAPFPYVRLRTSLYSQPHY